MLKIEEGQGSHLQPPSSFVNLGISDDDDRLLNHSFREVNQSVQETKYISIPRSHVDGPVEQSFAQGRLWFIDRLYPESTWYLVPLATRLRGPLHLDALNVALLALEERHEPLRTTFMHRDGVDLQVIHEFAPKQARVIPIPGGSWETLTQTLHQEHTTPFKLETEPGWRTAIFRLAEDDHVLSIVMHHIISDGWSLDILQRELSKFYSAAVRGQDPLSQVHPLPIQYKDFAVWQKQTEQTIEHQRQLEYWKRQLDGSQPAEFLNDKPRPTALSGVAEVHEVAIEGVLYRSLEQFCKKTQATPFAVLLAAFRATHYRLTGAEDATIGTPVANRNRQELENIIGFFVNLQCIRVTVEEETFETLVQRVLSTTAEAAAHQDVPFERIVAELRPGARDLSRNPLVQSVFAVHSQQNIGKLGLAGLDTESVGETRTSRFDLEFHFFQQDSHMHGYVMFSNELFDASSIHCMTSVFFEILERGLADPTVSIATVPLTRGLAALADMGLTQVARTDYPRDSSVPALFRQQAAISANTVAVKDASSQLTYAELDAQSDRLADWLARQELRPETMVGVLAPRSCETIVAFLGILKANLAYLPLDVNVPPGRIESILSTVVGPKLVLLGAGVTAPVLTLTDVEFLPIANTLDHPGRATSTNNIVRPEPSATSLAYVMFTSGSTGRPKGVMVEHRGIVRLVKNTNVMTQAQAAVPIAHIANLAFDAATWEIYAALLNGGTVICIDHMTVLDPVCLSRVFLGEGITAMYCAPSLLRQLIDEMPSALRALDVLIIGGEIFRTQDAFNAQRLVKGSVLNCYGNTENTGYTAIYRISRRDAIVDNVPIGRTISNSGVLVMDPRQQVVPLGVMGEIVLIGDGVARGYTDASLDQGRFQHIEVNERRVKAYRTGDRGRYRPRDAQLEFFGRMDYQVKIRGHRIEMGEVEHTLVNDCLVKDAVVLAHAVRGTESELISFVTIDWEVASLQPEQEENVCGKNDEGEQIRAWTSLFDNRTYAKIDTITTNRLGRDFMGWKSMYDGEPIDRAQMNEWLDETIAAIQATGPLENVLEIGTGTGMILFNLAEHLQCYVGLDPSAAAVSFVANVASADPSLAEKVDIRVGTAADIGKLGPLVSPNLVIVNSVAQYFSSAQYLLNTVESILRLKTVERIFFGDIRSLALYREFKVSKSLHTLGDRATKSDMRRNMATIEETEEELLIDPGFFTSLLSRFPDRIEHVEILPKRMKATNELSCYRFAAVIYLRRYDGPPRLVRDISSGMWTDFQAEHLNRTGLLRLLHDSSASDLVAVSNIPYSKTVLERHLAQVLDDGVNDETAEDQADWLAAVRASARCCPALSAYDISELAEAAGFRVELSWARQSSLRGALDAIFHRVEGQRPLFQFQTDHQGRPAGSFTNRPLRRQETQKIESYLRCALQATLPSYMIPSRITVLDSMPLNPNGKVDRRALQQLALTLSENKGPRSIVPAQTPVERALCEEFAHVLGMEVGLTDNFFDLGGHSLMATRVVSRINRRLDVSLTVRDVFACPIVADLAAKAGQSLGETKYISIPRSHVDGPVEQSFAQGRLWFIDRLYPESTWYLVPLATRLRGPLHLDALNVALLALEERHEPLRTTFMHRDGVDLQVIHEFAPKQARVIPIPGGSWETLTQTLHQEHTTPFKLETEPGWRTAIFRLAEDDHVLSIVMHHIISDGWSLDILQRELSKFYSAAVRGQDPLSQVHPLPIQYKDFAVWQKQTEQTIEHQRQLEYWKRQLDGSQPAEFLNDKPRPTALSGVAEVHEVAIEGVLYRSLEQFCKKTQATPFAVLLAAFRATHYRLTGAEDATIGTLSNGRNRQELEDIIGFFVNLQCIRTTVKDESFQALVRQVLLTTAEAAAHQDVPFDRIVAECRPGPRDLSRNPLVQNIISFNAQENINNFQIRGLETHSVGETKTSRFDLEFNFFQQNDCVRGQVLFATDLFDASSIHCITSVFFEILERGLADPTVSIATVPLTRGLAALADMGLTQVARTDYPRDSSVPALFRQQAAISANTVAVKDASSQLTYAELDAQSDRLADWLARQELRPETMANLAYLPLDVNVPPGRIESILSTVVGPKLVLLGAGVTAPVLTLTDVEFLPIANTLDHPGRATSTNNIVRPEPSATSLAYVMFTSGSTGRPKGVMVEHRGIVRLVKNTNVMTQAQAAVPIAHITNIAFDNATWEIYMALLNGGTLVCIDHRTLLDVHALGRVLKEQGVKAAMFTPALLKQFLRHIPNLLTGITTLVSAGDRLDHRDATEARMFIQGKFINAYGPTENTTSSTFYVIPRHGNNVNGVPIGRAISNSGAFVMDPQHRLVPLGVMGELVVTGDGLARGYTDPALDTDRFVHLEINGQLIRVYRTGDRVRYRPTDGELEFFGRMDHQVKIRGHRVELAEVEDSLLREDLVSDAAAMARELEGDVELVAFVTVHRYNTSVYSADTRRITAEQYLTIPQVGFGLYQDLETLLRNALRAVLPAYMIPSRIRVLDEMPLNANGKVDRRALAALMTNTATVQDSRRVVPPRTDKERAICEEFAGVLGFEIGITDNFFDVGGHSLMATRLLSRINTRLHCNLILRDLYRHSSPEELCQEINLRATNGFDPGMSHSYLELHARDNNRTTLILIHGFWGLGSVFAGLVPMLHDALNVLIVHDPFFGRPQGPQTVYDWAVFYLTALKEHVPSDHCVILGGYSSGALIALKMASMWCEWHAANLKSVVLLDPGIYEVTDISKLDPTAIDDELQHGLQLFGHDQRVYVQQHFTKLGPLMLSLRGQPKYRGRGLYVSTNDTLKSGVSQWWANNYPLLQVHHVSTTHHTLFEGNALGELSKAINQQCVPNLHPLGRNSPAVAIHRGSKIINVDMLSSDDLSEQIRQSLIGISNGIAAEKVIFTTNHDLDAVSLRALAAQGLAKALTGPYHWAVQCYWLQNDEPVLIMLSARRYNSYKSSYSGLLDAVSDLLTHPKPTAQTLYRLAYELDNRSLHLIAPQEANKAMAKLLSIAQGDSMLLASLAAEILTHQGTPTLPAQAIRSSQQKAGAFIDLNGTTKNAAATFEKRINVDDYNFFELVHPAYFRQTVALATMVTKFITKPSSRAMDVGPGPGSNLLAFCELMPHTEILAIEPSDVAFQYLKDHFRNNSRVKCLQEDFLNLPVEPEGVDYIMSTGASHHFNTDAFLQRSIEWLRPGGYWCIADEMISPFTTRTERMLNLLRHHLAYMTPLCFPWSGAEREMLTPSERDFVDDYNHTIPHAKFHADIGGVDDAEALCRELLSRTEQRGFTTKVSDPKLAFWRLQWLELQALIAGLDYEVEQKTYPQHFKQMAEGAGLVCVAHERVYGTTGLSDEDAGTHVMVFQKA
ncbi:Beauvericin nonribosomal cyclodepsipeptide synthetase BEA1 [Penicillium oxalicum]|uniref:Beauvericin nonribosomal cyclodepsipeptide synthetase BEA1 n=1 Tax=Penicillium oxalicum TaxID=69781 RepID=UPI0020B7A850|nr:Beauvericin nonribosomal cyclodepsipeptide synthetase BEA1 [Penicillium oxalicum]KAI2787072.1 Beauvericin nonribosomal cyclodepsipeptide synthetase BEA1 [Penicillium oxalicum]